MDALRWCKQAGVVLIANATKIFGKGTKLKPTVEQKEQLVISFDRSLAWEELDFFDEDLQRNRSAIQFAFSSGSQEFAILDTRNIHGFIASGEIASVSVIGEVDVFRIQEIVTTCNITLFHWVKGPIVWDFAKELVDTLAQNFIILFVQ